jgi:Rieske Fe-S protein
MTDESQRDQRDLFATRRCVLLGAGILGAAGALTACSTDAVPYDANDAGQAPSAAATAVAPAGASGTAGAGQPGTLLGESAAVPVGGGIIYTTAKVVVTQPAKGEYKAFSAVCTHVGCLCNQVTDGTIDCPCHGSKFNITDGSVVTGPASSPLATANITVSDGKILLA